MPELFAGDINPYRGDARNKVKQEKMAAEKLFSMLPDDLRHKFIKLFDEYVDQESKESKIAKSADKLMPLIQNICTTEKYSSYREIKVTYEEAKNYLDKFFPNDDVLKNLYSMLLEEAHAHDVFYSEGKR